MKILVIGFQRSGTTLLKDLVWKHLDVKHMFHEVALMRFPKSTLLSSKTLPDKHIRNNYQGTRTYSHTVDFNILNDTWGEKIPYWVPRIFKGFRGSVGKYCKIWNTYFGSEARILNIVRHPLDVAISTKNRGFTKGIGQPIKQYKITMPRVIQQFENFGINNIMHVQFENLVTNPFDSLVDIYNFCNLRSGKKIVNGVIKNKNIFRFRKINPKRAFSHKAEGKKPSSYGLDGVLKILNNLKGIEYK